MHGLIAGLLVLAPLLFAPAVAAETDDGILRDTVGGVFSEIEREAIGRYYNGDQDAEAAGEADGEGDRDDGVKKGKKHKDRKAGKGNSKSKQLPPGLAKRDELPPGLARQLERNGTLPPGLAKRELPADLDSGLPPVEEGLERVIVDTSVVLVEKATGVVKDIIRDVITGNDGGDTR